MIPRTVASVVKYAVLGKYVKAAFVQQGLVRHTVMVELSIHLMIPRTAVSVENHVVLKKRVLVEKNVMKQKLPLATTNRTTTRRTAKSRLNGACSTSTAMGYGC